VNSAPNPDAPVRTKFSPELVMKNSGSFIGEVEDISYRDDCGTFEQHTYAPQSSSARDEKGLPEWSRDDLRWVDLETVTEASLTAHSSHKTQLTHERRPSRRVARSAPNINQLRPLALALRQLWLEWSNNEDRGKMGCRVCLITCPRVDG
jgi:hypothetical protein